MSHLPSVQPHFEHWQFSPQQHAVGFAAGEADVGVVIPKAPAVNPTRAVIKNLDMAFLRECGSSVSFARRQGNGINEASSRRAQPAG
jgi:hypothetical protein